jgi:hypothetical protein
MCHAGILGKGDRRTGDEKPCGAVVLDDTGRNEMGRLGTEVVRIIRK